MGADIRKYNPGEEEVLYNIGNRFRVVDIAKKQDISYIFWRKRMKDKKLFSAKRWNEPLGLREVGYTELTKEEKENYHNKSVKILKQLGVILDEKEIEDEKHAE